MKYFSLFSGIGGFELGIHNAFGKKKVNCVGYSEIDKYAIAIYEKHFPTHKNFGDVRTINTKDIPDFDFLVGGFPCQAFSVAGKRRGFSDSRGTLFFEIARILRDKKPKCFLLENVKGLLSHDNGRTFKIIITTLDEVGYDVQWQVLNSKDFGVPQRRERIFIVGCLRGTRRHNIFPFQETIANAHAKNSHKKTGLRCLFDGGAHGRRIYDVTGSCPTLTTCTGGNKVPIVAITNASPREFRWNDTTCPALCAVDYKHPKLVTRNHRIRKLTPTECERLQGFPDGWTEGISNSQRYKCLGNAVTVNVIEGIVKKIDH